VGLGQGGEPRDVGKEEGGIRSHQSAFPSYSSSATRRR
jgi:hypothetical protein